MKALHLLEGLIFASREPVTEAVMRDVLGRSGFEPSLVPQLLEQLTQDYQSRAVTLQKIGPSWHFRTRHEYAAALTRVIEKPRRLTRAAMETLAIIAYHQPCTRGDIESIRGVSLSQAVFDALIEERLIAPSGRKDVPGRPVLWATTSRFLAKFGLENLSALPRREELILDPDLLDVPEDDAEDVAPVATS